MLSLFHQDIQDFIIDPVSLDRPLPVCQHDIPGISDQAGKEFFYTPLSEINFCPVFINKVIHSPKGLLYFLLISL